MSRTLNNCVIGQDGAKLIAKWLEQNETLRIFSLTGSKFHSCLNGAGARFILEALQKNKALKLKSIDMRGNRFPGSPTCIWPNDTEESLDDFIKKQLEILDGSVAAGDEAMDDGEENHEDKNSKDVDLEPSKILADLLQSVGRNFTEESDDEIYQMEEEEDQGKENSEDDKA